MTGSALQERRFEPVLVYSATAGLGAVRLTTLLSLAVAPFAIGCRYPPAYVPLLVVVFGAGAYSLYRETAQRRAGVVMAAVPGERVLLALIAVVALQLVPLPPALLRVVSPGSFSFYNDRLLLPLSAWKPITASPPDTARGLVFLAAMALLYRAVYREFDHPTWRRRLVIGIVTAGFFMTIEALVQQAYSAHVIYGVWRPLFDWAVFGPYITKNLFAGYMLMAVALGMALCLESLDALRRAWKRRRRRAWLALGDAEGNAFLRWAAISMVLVTGLLATGSRGGLLGLAAIAATFVVVARRRGTTVLAVALVAALGLAWIGLAEHRAGFVTRGLSVRREVWIDSLSMIPDHPVFGAGFNAFGTSYPPRQHVWRTLWIGTTHNEYLQIVIDLGLAGVIPAGLLMWTLLRRGAAAARVGPLQAGAFAGVVAVMAHNLVDYNWQLAANAATFAALAGLAMQSPSGHLDPLRRPA